MSKEAEIQQRIKTKKEAEEKAKKEKKDLEDEINSINKKDAIEFILTKLSDFDSPGYKLLEDTANLDLLLKYH